MLDDEIPCGNFLIIGRKGGGKGKQGKGESRSGGIYTFSGTNSVEKKENNPGIYGI